MAIALCEVAVHISRLPQDPGWLDTYVYARGASNFLAHPTHLYDAAMPQLASSRPVNAFIYPPSALLVFMPLVPVTRTLGVGWASALWSMFDSAALLFGLVLIARQLGIRAEHAGWALVAMMLSLPVLSEVASGQVGGAIVLLLALSWRTWPRASSGVLLGAALAIKPMAPLLLLLPLALRRPRISAVAIATFLALNLVFAPFLGIHGLSFYVFHFLPYMEAHPMQDVANVAVGNVLQSWMHSTAFTEVALWALRATALLFLARALLHIEDSPVVPFAIALATVPLLAGTAWPHYYVCVLPGVLLLLTAQSISVRRVTWGALLASLVLNAVLDVATIHLSPYPASLGQDRSFANVLVVLEHDLLTMTSVIVVIALALVRPTNRAAIYRNVEMGLPATGLEPVTKGLRVPCSTN